MGVASRILEGLSRERLVLIVAGLVGVVQIGARATDLVGVASCILEGGLSRDGLALVVAGLVGVIFHFLEGGASTSPVGVVASASNLEDCFVVVGGFFKDTGFRKEGVVNVNEGGAEDSEMSTGVGGGVNSECTRGTGALAVFRVREGRALSEQSVTASGDGLGGRRGGQESSGCGDWGGVMVGGAIPKAAVICRRLFCRTRKKYLCNTIHIIAK